MFFLSPLCGVVGLVTEDHHSTQGCLLIVIFGFESHTEGSGIRTLAPRYHRKSTLLLFCFHFLDVCRHIAVDTTAVPERGITCLAILAYCNVLIYFVSAFYAVLMCCTLR